MYNANDPKLKKKAEKLDEQFDTGITTMGMDEDNLNGIVGLMRAAGVPFEYAEDLNAVYFDFPKQSPKGGN